MKTLSTFLITTAIIGSLFGQAKSEEAAYQPDWASYLTTVDGRLSLVATDLNLAQIAPNKKQVILTYISIEMKSPEKDGLSSQKEEKVLGEIEDALIAKLDTAQLDFSVAGRLTSDGYRELYFYSADKVQIEQHLLLGMIPFDGYIFQIGSQGDPNWKTYFDFLFPLPQQMQIIRNYRVLDEMQEDGDDLTKAREVFHWAYFKKESQLNAFEKYTLKKGFKTISKGATEGKSDYGLMIQISRVDKIGYEQINEYTLKLWKKAKKLKGMYDGWETALEN